MRSLTATLTAAQEQTSSRPYVQSHLLRLPRRRLSSALQPPLHRSEGEYYTAVVGAGDGSLVRARIDPSTKVLYTQRVTAPGPSSDFSQWTSHGTVSASGAVALAASGASVFLFYVDADTVTLKQKESADNGASYGSATTVATAASAVTYLAAAVAPGGDRALFWTIGTVVWKSRYAGGSWGTPAAWTNSADSITGIACIHRTDWNLVLCGTAPTSQDAKAWTLIYGDGGFPGRRYLEPAARSPPLPPRPASASTPPPSRSCSTGASSWSRSTRARWPIRACSGRRWARTPATISSGGVSRRPSITKAITASAPAWRGGQVWLAAPAGVWSAASPTWADREVTADVLEAEIDLDEYDGRARLVLRNDPTATGAAGRYSGYGEGDLSAIRRGARLQLSPGYNTTVGAEASAGPTFWIESVELETGPRGGLIVRARDGWWLLEQWRARRQFAWPAGDQTVSQIIMLICARAGLDNASLSSSSAFTSLKPAFTIHPGEDGKTALRRLLAMVPDEAIMRGGTCFTRYPQATDASDYA